MIDRSSQSSCAKCGRVVQPGAGFCPNCGTQYGATNFLPATQPDPHDTSLKTTHFPIGSSGGHAPTLAPAANANAPAVGPTAVATSLDSPSARPLDRPGDGPFKAGQQIGQRYTILKLLGTGGMGAVYQAFDHELGVAVAIKVIRPAAQSDATAAKDLEQRFKRELVLARQVTHKHVVRIHDLGEIDGIKYLTMPFVEGETLAFVLQREGKLPLARAIRFAQQIAQGLAAAHEKGVVHRDLKPENIMLERRSDEPIATGGDALILDFGIARSMETGTTQTAAGSVIGTIEYMAPEQAQGRKVDQRADQYAFGLILYDMLVGRNRLASRDNPMAELLERLNATPPPPRSIDPAIPESVERIVMTCLQPLPDARFASTQELVAALDHLAPDGHIRSDVREIIVHDGGRPAWQLAVTALVIVAIAGTAGWVVSNRTSPDAATAAARDPVSVLIADFDNKTGDAIFDGVVEQAVSLGIEGASFITTYPRRDALRAAAAIKPGAKLDEQTARLVALREGINTIVTGSIEPRGGGRYRIAIKGIGPGNDAEVKYSLEDDADGKATVLATVGELAGLVRKALGDTAAPAPNDAFTAASLEAASTYVRAQELLAAGNLAGAIPVYLEAAKLDPDFGRAWSGAATAAANMGRAEEADQYYKNALARIDRMTDREKFRTRGQYYLFAGNGLKAVEELSALIDRYPSDGVGLSNLALAHFQLRQFDKATEFAARASALNPNNVPRINNAALYAMYAGKFEDAIAQGKKASELNKEYPRAWLVQGLSAEALGRHEEASAAYAALAALPGWKGVAALAVADAALLRGRLADAAAALEPMLAEKLPAQQQARIRTTLASVRLAQGRSADAVKLAEDVARSSSDATARFEAGRVLLAGGRAARAKEIAAELDKSLSPERQALGLALAGEVQLVSGALRDAIASFQSALKLADAWQTRYLLGRAYLAGEAHTEANSEFDACLERQGEAAAVYLDDMPTWRMIAPVYYYQGLALTALKSTAGATEAFRTFLAFKDSDEQNPLVADARKRLASH